MRVKVACNQVIENQKVLKNCLLGCNSQATPLSRNRPFSYSENECGSNDISLQFVEFSNVHNCNRSSNATLSNLAYKIV